MTTEEAIKAIKKELRSFCERCEDSFHNYDCNDCIIEIAQEEATEALVLVKQWQTEIKREAKAEAYKEFAERLKSYLLLKKKGEMSVISFENVDTLLKEMVGEKE